jgi:hypothetical protein
MPLEICIEDPSLDRIFEFSGRMKFLVFSRSFMKAAQVATLGADLWPTELSPRDIGGRR